MAKEIRILGFEGLATRSLRRPFERAVLYPEARVSVSDQQGGRINHLTASRNRVKRPGGSGEYRVTAVSDVRPGEVEPHSRVVVDGERFKTLTDALSAGANRLMNENV
jgi:hypothetical protein